MTTGSPVYFDSSTSKFRYGADVEIPQVDVAADSGTLSENTAWSDVPSKSVAGLNTQANALQQRTNWIRANQPVVVTNVAALRLLDKTKIGYAITKGYYTAGDGGAGEYWYDGSDTTSIDNGGTVIKANDGGIWKIIVTNITNVKQFGAKGDGVSVDTVPITNCLSVCQNIYFPSGTYVVGTLSLKGKSYVISGDGEDVTTIKGNAAVPIIDVQETSDTLKLPIVISKITLDGNNIATSGISTRYRHKTKFENITITNIAGDGLSEIDSWDNYRLNLTINNCVNGLVLQGANNDSNYTGISLSNNSQYQIKIMNGGTVSGGSTAVAFNSCDVEFADGDGIYVNTIGTVRFNDCYLGDHILGKTFDIYSGEVIVSGGITCYGRASTSYLGYLTSGKLLLKGSYITGGSSAVLGNMFYSLGGKAIVEDCPSYITVSGAQVMYGDPLDFGKQYDTFTNKLGRQFTGYCLNGTFSTSITGNSITATCLTSTGSSTILELHSSIAPNWRTGEVGALVVVYKSSKDCSVRLTSGTVGVMPAINIDGTLPATSDKKTAILLGWIFTDQVYPTMLEIFQTSSVETDYITLYDVYLMDSKTVKSDSVANFYNLYKS